MKTQVKIGTNGRLGRLDAVLGDFAKGGVIDVEEKAKASRHGHPVWSGMKIPNRRQEEAKLARFIDSIGIRPLNPATGVLCDDGSVFWQFCAEFPPKAMATIIKKHNEHNRQVGPERAKQYASDISCDNWGFTGEPILFSGTGDLLDGQNRTIAGLACDKTMIFAVGFGLTAKAFRSMGRHLARSNAHLNQAEGRSYTHVRTPTLSLIRRFEKSGDAHDYLEETGAGIRLGGPQQTKLNEYYKDELEPALTFIHGLRWGVGTGALPKHVATLMFMLMARQSPEAARYFMLSVADATHAMPGSPAYALRNKLLKLYGDRRNNPGRHRANVSEQIGKGENSAVIARGTEALIMRNFAFAWNSFCAGRKNSSGSFVNHNGSTTTPILRSMSKPGPKALEEAKALGTEAVTAILKRAEACREFEEQKAIRKNTDEGDVKLSAIKKSIETA